MTMLRCCQTLGRCQYRHHTTSVIPRLSCDEESLSSFPDHCAIAIPFLSAQHPSFYAAFERLRTPSREEPSTVAARCLGWSANDHDFILSARISHLPRFKSHLTGYVSPIFLASTHEKRNPRSSMHSSAGTSSGW